MPHLAISEEQLARFVDSWRLFDNSEAAGPRLIAEGKMDAAPTIQDQESWQRLMEMAR